VFFLSQFVNNEESPMNELKPFAKGVYPYALLFLAILLMWYAGKNTQIKADYQIPTLIDERYSCNAGDKAPNEHLTVYMSTEQVARQLADLLCQNAVVKQQYHQVQVFWGGGDAAAINYIGKGLGDLVNTKDNIVHAFDAEKAHGFVRLASYPDFQAYLIGRTEKPLLTREYLLGRRLGLLDYPTSRSGNIIPMHMLQELGVRPDQITIVYSHNHSGLRELLAAGKVDMIASYWAEQDRAQFSEHYIQPIGTTDVSGSAWYLKMNSRNTDLLCAVQATLVALSKQQQSGYFTQLDLAAGCPEHKLGDVKLQ